MHVYGELSGTLTAPKSISGALSAPKGIQGILTIPTSVGIESYTGAYEVTPTSSDQYLLTKNKTMTKKVTVYATPYTEVSNLYGGKTVTIL